MPFPKPNSAIECLRDWCLKNQEDLKELNLFKDPIPEIRVILPPLELLYALKKGHIHRIVPCTSSQQQNIEIWHRQMKMYTWMREKLGYKKMDEILYGEDPYGDPVEPLEECMDLENTMRMIFLRNFEETNERIGDTHIDLERTEEEFFEDNVKRYIEHDELHRRVAMIYRGEEEELFTKYQEPGSVNLVKELYFKYPLSEHIQCYVEEISVLLAERKMIPTLVKCYKEEGIPFIRFDPKKIQEDLQDIVAHFGTNLCGKGHFWLRRYFLDHYTLIFKESNFDLKELQKLAVEIVDFKDPEEDEETADLREKVEEWMSKSSYNEIIHRFKEEFDIQSSYMYTPDYSNNLVINTFSMEYGMGWDEEEVFLSPEDVPKYILKLIKRMEDNPIIYCGDITKDNYALFDLENRVGVHHKEKQWYIFHLDFDYEKDDTKQVRITGDIYKLNGEKIDGIDEKFKLRVNCYYYESSDNSCGYRNKHDGPSLLFVSNYGVNPIGCTVDFLESVSRVRLKLRKDEKPPDHPPYDEDAYYMVKYSYDAGSKHRDDYY